MNYGNILPVTGGASVLLLGRWFGLDDVIAAALTAVLFGIAIYRFSTRITDRHTTVFVAVLAVAAGVALAAHAGAGVGWGYATTAGLAVAIAVLYAAAWWSQSRQRAPIGEAGSRG